MNNVEVLLLLAWVIVGFASLTWGISLYKKNIHRRQVLLVDQVEVAEKNLLDDLERIGMAELIQTQAGKEIIGIIKGIRQFQAKQSSVTSTSSEMNHRKLEPYRSGSLPELVINRRAKDAKQATEKDWLNISGVSIGNDSPVMSRAEIVSAIPGESEAEFSSRLLKEYKGLDGTIEMVFKRGLPDFAIIKASIKTG